MECYHSNRNEIIHHFLASLNTRNFQFEFLQIDEEHIWSYLYLRQNICKITLATFVVTYLNSDMKFDIS